jgi:hypothetical protein
MPLARNSPIWRGEFSSGKFYQRFGAVLLVRDGDDASLACSGASQSAATSSFFSASCEKRSTRYQFRALPGLPSARTNASFHNARFGRLASSSACARVQRSSDASSSGVGEGLFTLDGAKRKSCCEKATRKYCHSNPMARHGNIAAANAPKKGACNDVLKPGPVASAATTPALMNGIRQNERARKAARQKTGIRRCSETEKRLLGERIIRGFDQSARLLVS